jgi:phosphate transport system substrate-binding protein
MTGDVQVPRKNHRLTAVLSLMLGFVAVSSAVADPLIMQGSSTFNRQVMEPHEAEIEAKSGQEITVIPNRTPLGIIALLEGRAHMAMTSAGLQGEVDRLKKVMPGLDYDRLRSFEVAKTRAAFVVNAANPVRRASVAQIKKIMTGEITNWKELGGNDGPIRVIGVAGGGGVITAVEAELLDGKATHSPQLLYVKTALQLVSVVEQEPLALGMAQLSLARQRGLPEIVTDRPIEQSLSLITFGEPTPAMKAVIDAARAVLEKTM